MICIGIESTAHTFACAVIDEKGNILSDVRKVYSTEKGGMIPIEVAKHHEEIKDNIINEAIEKSKQKRFDLISYIFLL